MVPNPFQALIEKYAALRGFEPDLIARQIEQESAFNPSAISPCGAMGLMQITAAAAADLHISFNGLRNPELNLIAGTAYLQIQWRHFPEIPDRDERLKFALAAYNCGRGYINKALGLNSLSPHRFPPIWDLMKCYLFHPACLVGGHNPDAAQTVEYVWRIWTNFERDRLNADRFETSGNMVSRN